MLYLNGRTDELLRYDATLRAKVVPFQYRDIGDDKVLTHLKPYCISLPNSTKLKAQMKAEREKVSTSIG